MKNLGMKIKASCVFQKKGVTQLTNVHGKKLLSITYLITEIFKDLGNLL